jgi:hypothetical protein
MLLLRLLLSAMGAQATVIELARHSSIHKLEAMGGSSGARSNSSLLLAARFFVKLVEIFLLIQSINSSMAKLHATTPIPTHESINGDLKLVRISSGISLARARARTGGSACQHGLHLHGAVRANLSASPHRHRHGPPCVNIGHPESTPGAAPARVR